jgi:sugar lactone lactonase YvrE
MTVCRTAVLALLLLAVAAVPASGARPALQQPYDVLPLANGHLVVSDLPAGAVYDIDTTKRSARLIARVPNARDLALLPDGRILVTSRAKVLAITPRTGKLTPYLTARSYLLGIALAPGGGLYGSENVPGHEETTLVLLRGGTRTVLADGLRGVHGIQVAANGGLILGESYAGRVLRLDPATKQIEVLATGLAYPGFELPAAGGGWFVSELGADRIARLWPDGHVTKVADAFQPGPIAFDSRRRIVGVSQNGTVFRVAGGQSRRIYP